MKPSPFGSCRSLFLGALLCLLPVLSGGPLHAAPVRLPPVPEAEDLGWVRQPFFESLPAWNLDPILFPPASRVVPARPSGPAETGWNLLSQAEKERGLAENSKNNGRLHEEAARLYLRAYAADRKGDIGFLALRMAARSYLIGGRYNEAAGVATTLIKRFGGGGADLPFYLLKGEALYQKRDLLAARECFRRAQTGRFDPQTVLRIELRIADASLELGNIAYAEPAYRKALAGAAIRRKLPFNTIRFGEAMLASGNIKEAASLFRSMDIETDGFPPVARALALIGAGDAALLSGALVDAQTAYERAGSVGPFPETKDLLKMRTADHAFAGGNRQEALAGYKALKSSMTRAIAREALYKVALTMYLMGDFPGTVREAEGWIARHGGKTGEKGMRTLVAKAGVEMVRAAGKANPANRWPALSELLFAYGRTKEWPLLLAEIGKEWEDARIWGGAADLYASAGDPMRSNDMRRIGRAEAAYYRGDNSAVFAELGWKGPAGEQNPAALWLATKTFFRQGRHVEADAALRRFEAAQAGSAATHEKSPFPPAKELAAFNRAELGRWAELLDGLKDVPPQPDVPGLSMIRALAESKKPGDPETEAKPKKGAPAAPAGRDLYDDYLRVRERVGRINSEEALQ